MLQQTAEQIVESQRADWNRVAGGWENLFAKLSPGQQVQARHGILRAANRFTRRGTIALPIAVRMVAARKPI